MAAQRILCNLPQVQLIPPYDVRCHQIFLSQSITNNNLYRKAPAASWRRGFSFIADDCDSAVFTDLPRGKFGGENPLSGTAD